MPAVDNSAASTRSPDLHLRAAEQELYAGILASLGALVGRYSAAPHTTVDGFRMAYALLDGLPPQVVVGVAAEAMRSLSCDSTGPQRLGAP